MMNTLPSRAHFDWQKVRWNERTACWPRFSSRLVTVPACTSPVKFSPTDAALTGRFLQPGIQDSEVLTSPSCCVIGDVPTHNSTNMRGFLLPYHAYRPYHIGFSLVWLCRYDLSRVLSMKSWWIDHDGSRSRLTTIRCLHHSACAPCIGRCTE